MIKDIIKDWRVLFMFAFVALAIFSIGFSFQKGVIVSAVNSSSPLVGKISVGNVITWVNEININSPSDLAQFENYTGSFRYIHNGKLDIVDIANPGLGLTVTAKPFTNLNLGLDLVGGTRVLLQPTEKVSDAVTQQIVATLETRINTFGLREARFESVKDVSGNNLIQIEMAGGSQQEIENLLAKQGRFEAKIPKNITFTNNVGLLKLGKDNYTVQLIGDKIQIGNNILSLNDTSIIKNIDFQFANLTNNTATLSFIVFKGEDIKSVCIVEQPGVCISRVIQVQNGWEFDFQIFVTQESAQKFADVTSDLSTVFAGKQSYLSSSIALYLDNKLITDLSISSDLRGVALTSPSITGTRTTKDETTTEKLTLQSILQSGSLPTSLQIVKVDQISPTLGSEFERGALISALVAAATVSAVIYIRYRKVKILIPMMIWSLSELIITLGAAALIKWTLDLSSIAGLIAAIGTGTNDQIMIIDELLVGGGEGDERKIYTFKQRLKRAFFIIFGAAGTIVAAMIPLMFIGIGVMRGFAIVTTLGILIGVFITRPAFGRVMEKLLENQPLTASSKETTSKEEKK